MRLFLSIAAIACGCGAAAADPGKIIVDDANKVDDKRWKPYDVRLHREERVHGEVVVLSPPLFVRGPPKGFPFRVRTRRGEAYGNRSDRRELATRLKMVAEPLGRTLEELRAEPQGTFRAERAGSTTDGLEGSPRSLTRTKRAVVQVKPDEHQVPHPYVRLWGTSIGSFRARRAGTPHEHDLYDFQYSPRTKRAASHAAGRQNRLPDFYQSGYQPRHPSYYQPGRIQGEVVVHSSALSIKGPPKGYPLRRKTRGAPESPQEKPITNKTQANSTKLEQSSTKHAASKTPNSTLIKSVVSKPAKGTSSVPSNPSKSSKSTLDSRKGQGTKVKPVKGRHSMMKRLKKMWPYMLIPTMMTLGYAPFVLSSVKMFVMNALMLNVMAFNAAIMLTLRNVVFGPRVGGHTKYVNYGYSRPHHHGHHDADDR